MIQFNILFFCIISFIFFLTISRLLLSHHLFNLLAHDNSSEILLSHLLISYNHLLLSILLFHHLFNPHLTISQTRRLSQRVQANHNHHELASSSLGCLFLRVHLLFIFYFLIKSITFVCRSGIMTKG